MKKILLLLMTLLYCSTSFAFDDGLDSRLHSKVMRAKRAQAMDSNNNQHQPGMGNSPCNGANIGNVYTDKSGRNAPRENTVVVTGDVIVIPGRECQ